MYEAVTHNQYRVSPRLDLTLSIQGFGNRYFVESALETGVPAEEEDQPAEEEDKQRRY